MITRSQRKRDYKLSRKEKEKKKEDIKEKSQQKIEMVEEEKDLGANSKVQEVEGIKD